MEILEIAKKINSAKGRLYLVGGALRDKILGVNSYDEDYCIVGLNEKDFEELFPTIISRGKSFKVYEIDGKEFALARVERKTGIGHKNFEIKTNKEITIEQDLARRDITINSIAQDVLTKEIIDPYNGISDIENKIIRATTENFKEDPLRVYRVARFASQLKFNVEEKTIKLMNSLKNELGTLSKERVFMEFKKALLSEKPSIFFEVLRRAGVLDIHFKEIYDLIGVLQLEKYHQTEDAYNHTMVILDEICQNTEKPEVRFAGLVHDIGKGLTQNFYNDGHDKNGIKLVKNLGDRVGVPKSWIKCGNTAVNEYMRAKLFFKMTPSEKVLFIETVGKSLLGLEGLQIVVDADKEIHTKNERFAGIGKQCLEEIDGNYIIEKYGNLRGVNFKEKLYEERVSWIRQIPYFPN